MAGAGFTLLLGLFLMQAPANQLERGAQVFKQSCAVGYCHGSGGTANRAPALKDRGFTAAHVSELTRQGKQGTAMPAFQGKLPEADLEAVIAYVMSLNPGGSSAASTPSPGSNPIPVAAKTDHPGRDIFFDPSRVPYCGTCHTVENWGSAVGPNLLADPPATGAAIRSASSANVKTATTPLGSFPALLVEQEGGRTKLFDLTGPLPVLRSFPSAQVKIEAGSWSHAQVVKSYSDRELEQIAGFLKAAAQ